MNFYAIPSSNDLFLSVHIFSSKSKMFPKRDSLSINPYFSHTSKFKVFPSTEHKPVEQDSFPLAADRKFSFCDESF